MSVIRAGLRPAFAFFVVAHGLAHAALPMRGWIDPGLPSDLTKFPIYSVVVLGFTIAGLGLLPVRPFSAMVRPALVLASAYSLIAIWITGVDGLWWAAGIDTVLLVAAFIGIDQRLPHCAARQSRGWGAIRRTLAVGVIAYATVAVWLWPLHRAWGSAPPERVMALPGDASGRNPALEIQHAVTVDAPPEAVWPWLVQLGQDRAGFYSYDWLERAFGVDIHNVAEIRPEWQTRQSGDRVRATQDPYLRGVLGRELGWTVREVQPNRAMVLGQWGAFVLEPTAGGQTRFIIRTSVGDVDTPVWAAALDMIAFELPHFIMERRMMLTIKALAEKSVADRAARIGSQTIAGE